MYAGCKENHFTACHPGKLKLAFSSPDVISTSPKSYLMSRIYFTVLLLFEFLKKHHCPSGKLRTEFTSPIAKSTSPGLSDTTFFARCVCHDDTAVLGHFYSRVITQRSIAGYWPSSVLRGQYPAIFTKTCSVDLPARVANQNTGFALSCPLVDSTIKF